MVGKTVQIKSTKLEPPELRGVRGEVIRENGYGYMVVRTADGRDVIIHPKSLRVAA